MRDLGLVCLVSYYVIKKHSRRQPLIEIYSKRPRVQVSGAASPRRARGTRSDALRSDGQDMPKDQNTLTVLHVFPDEYCTNQGVPDKVQAPIPMTQD